ncbi:uncharacterized protein LOC133534438 isoform X2 [Cydia pomonella]|uniref:uncharacterized protein LOC133534438 isoform X2 n=1 Tax=Cydia pomonella TaxID=82600 RepID=UPI002ADE6938|nr:uncharacterized protein LOC133534438 isoform X2 [Cydia pomonella]
MQSRIIFCTVHFIIYALPQGNTKTLKFDSSIEVGSNITSILQNLTTYLQSLQMKNPDLNRDLTVNAQIPQVESEGSNKLKERIMQLIKGMANKAGPSTTPTQYQEEIPDVVEESKGTPMLNWQDFWEIVKKMMNNVALTLANKPSQAIVQEADQKKEYSLLQNMKSGRVRGPVHVYGHHSGSREDD